MIASENHQSPPEKAEPARWSRPAVYRINRGLILLLVAAQWLTLQWAPTGVAGYVLDILVRSYGLFLLCSLAHEASHGNLGSRRRANLWWGRLAQLPTTVPNLSFRKTHHLHHRFTNEVGKDPDRFIHARVWWQLPLRALALPHAWLHFLYKGGRLRLRDGLEIATSYLMVGAFYGTAIAMVGPGRVLGTVLPALIVLSLCLWIPFGVWTHEGLSTGAQETRSHDYRGWFPFLATLGLSMHRAHHLYPNLAWMELADFVQPATRRAGGSRWPWRRHMILEGEGEGCRVPSP